MEMSTAEILLDQLELGYVSSSIRLQFDVHPNAPSWGSGAADCRGPAADSLGHLGKDASLPSASVEWKDCYQRRAGAQLDGNHEQAGSSLSTVGCPGPLMQVIGWDCMQAQRLHNANPPPPSS